MAFIPFNHLDPKTQTIYMHIKLVQIMVKLFFNSIKMWFRWFFGEQENKTLFSRNSVEWARWSGAINKHLKSMKFEWKR